MILSEKDFQRQVTDLAELHGWTWAHFRPAQTARGWRTPVSGPMGAGFPDLVLLRVRDRRLIFAELKADAGKVTAEQAAVLAGLEAMAAEPSETPPLGVWRRARVEVHVWRPRDFDAIQAVLR